MRYRSIRTGVLLAAAFLALVPVIGLKVEQKTVKHSTYGAATFVTRYGQAIHYHFDLGNYRVAFSLPDFFGLKPNPITDQPPNQQSELPPSVQQ